MTQVDSIIPNSQPSALMVLITQNMMEEIQKIAMNEIWMFLVVKTRTIKAMTMENPMPWKAYLMNDLLKINQHQLS
jgi:hypothetical protein